MLSLLAPIIWNNMYEKKKNTLQLRMQFVTGTEKYNIQQMVETIFSTHSAYTCVIF